VLERSILDNAGSTFAAPTPAFKTPRLAFEPSGSAFDPAASAAGLVAGSCFFLCLVVMPTPYAAQARCQFDAPLWIMLPHHNNFLLGEITFTLF
jgi:hypothetical protein